MTYLLFGIALTLSAVAEWYAIVGLMAIFAASPYSIALMGALLGASKLVIASWMYRNWKEIPLLLKSYFVIALTILMMLTSMGIFGYLSKAHSDQSLVSGDVQARIAVYDEKIKISKDNIEASRKALKQMDEAVDQIMARSTTETGADKAVAVRRGQQKDRTRLLAEITADQKTITKINEERAPIAAEIRKVEAEVGPIKYIAAMIYDDIGEGTLESAVRILIIMIVSVFDPLAVLMLIAANWQLKRDRGEPLIPTVIVPIEETIPEPVVTETSAERRTGDNIQNPTLKGVEYDSAGRRITP